MMILTTNNRVALNVASSCLSLICLCPTKPGVFFDLNPRGLKQIDKSPCIDHVRFSYGPPMQNLVLGMERIGDMISEWKEHPESCDMYAQESFGD